jgi:hypothetical protein
MGAITVEGERTATEFGDASTGAKAFTVGGFVNPAYVAKADADNKTVLIIAVAVVAAVYLLRRKRR